MGNTGVQNFIEMFLNRTGASQTFINKENVEYTLLPQKFSRHLTIILLGRIVMLQLHEDSCNHGKNRLINSFPLPTAIIVQLGQYPEM